MYFAFAEMQLAHHLEKTMKKIAFILSLFLLVPAGRSFSCSCDPQGAFLDVAPRATFVALVKVKQYSSFREINNEPIPMSMDVEVIKVYKGKEERKTVKVWGDNGRLCRPYLSQFKPGQYYVIAFSKGMDGAEGYTHKNETPSDYAISICGDFWLDADIDKQMAKGKVSEKEQEIPLSKLESSLLVK